MGAFLRKAKVFLRLWVTRIRPLEPNVRYPIKNSYSIIGTVGLLLVIWWYFYGQVSYESIPPKTIFWSSFFGWALPFVILGWAYRKKSSRRELNAFANLMIAVGIIGLTIVLWGKQYDSVVRPVLYAALPGVMSGCLIGADSVWIWGLYKRWRGKNKKSPIPDSQPKTKPLPSTTTDDSSLDSYQ